MFIFFYSFSLVIYILLEVVVLEFFVEVNKDVLVDVVGVIFNIDFEYKAGIQVVLGDEVVNVYELELFFGVIFMNLMLVFIGIFGFVVFFVIFIGLVMWVLFLELFFNKVCGLVIFFVGFINFGVSFLVQFIFFWEFVNFGSSIIFFIYGVFGVIGVFFVLFVVFEIKGKLFEELEYLLVKED